MRSAILGALVAACLSTGMWPLAAQTSSDPPALFRISCEDVKQGSQMAHERTEEQFTRLLIKSKYPSYFIAAETITGPPQLWVFEGHTSFLDLARTQEAMQAIPGLLTRMAELDARDGELRTASRTMIARLQPDSSYRPASFMKELARMRVLSIGIIQLQPGAESDFREALKLRYAAEEKAGRYRPTLMYEIVSGDRVDTWLSISALESVGVLDADTSRTDTAAASLTPEYYRLLGDAVVSRQKFLLSFNPRLSFVSPEFAALDPNFWTPRPAYSGPSSGGSAGRPAER